jgi:hypothetical protein
MTQFTTETLAALAQESANNHAVRDFFSLTKGEIIAAQWRGDELPVPEVSDRDNKVAARVLRRHLPEEITSPGHKHHSEWVLFRDWAEKRGLEATWSAGDDGNEDWHLLKVRRRPLLERVVRFVRKLFGPVSPITL